VLQGFFAASEISFISSRLVKLRHRQAKGDIRAAKIYRLMEEPERFLTTTLVGINLSLVISSSLLTFFLIKLGVRNSNLWITLMFTPVIVVFAELIPKNIGRIFREDFNYRVIGVISFFEKLLYPVVESIDFFNKLLVKVILGKAKKRSLFVTKEEIKSIVKEIEKEGGIDRGEKEAIEEVFEFRISKIKDVCVNIRDIAAFDYTDSYEKILEIVWQKGFTRYPVFKNKEIIGYINIYDLFYHQDKSWQSFIRPITKVGVSQKLYSVFALLKSKKESIALVIKGKKAYGMITLQDIIREIITSIVKI
jgi:putative hemolysin